MKCYVCHRNIKPGLESQKRIEERQAIENCHWPDCRDSGACDAQGHQCTKLVLFGEGQPGGPLEKAVGPLLRAWHSKCFHAGRKRVLRGGDAVLGTNPEFAALLDSPDGLEDQKEENAGENQ